MRKDDMDDYIKEKANALRIQDAENRKIRREKERFIRRERNRKRRRDYIATHRSVVVIAVLLAILLLAAIIALIYCIEHYRVTKIYIEGSTHYTDEEITSMVMTGPLGYNSLYLTLKYRDKGVEDVPFVEKMDVTIVDPNTIRISVYEKALAGYVNYLGTNMYFARDGTVIEASKEVTEGVPEVTGLHFAYIVLYQKLPVENQEVFQRILDVTQLLKKNNLSSDKIYFDSNNNMTLYFDQVKVELGQDEYTDEKISNLQFILPSLEGRAGTLEMTSYSPEANSITFHDKK